MLVSMTALNNQQKLSLSMAFKCIGKLKQWISVTRKNNDEHFLIKIAYNNLPRQLLMQSINNVRKQLSQKALIL